MQWKIAVVATVLLAGCSDGNPPSAHPVQRDAGMAIKACPRLPASMSLEIKQEEGIDFLSCEVIEPVTRAARFSIYVGNFPNAPRRMRYFGPSRSEHGNLVWFSDADAARSSTQTLWTFIPTGRPNLSVVMVSMHGIDLANFQGRASLVAQLNFGNQ